MTNAMRRARVMPATRWALGRTASSVLAERWEVSPSRARHRRADGEDCVTASCTLTRDPKVDGGAIVTAHMEALVGRYIEEAKAGPVALREKYDRLVQREEHFAQARQDQALQTGEGVNAAAMEHAEMLVEIVAIRCALGMEEDR